jgi:hypothetical protein
VNEVEEVKRGRELKKQWERKDYQLIDQLCAVKGHVTFPLFGS